MNFAGVIVAAGQGSRLGAGRPKAFIDVLGQPLFAHALARLAAARDWQSVIVVCPADRVREVHDALPRLVEGRAWALAACAGGASRQESVLRGLRAAAQCARERGEPEPGGVLIADAARAATPPEVYARVADAVADGAEAVIPVVPVADSLRAVEGPVVDRGRIRAVQTPQGFAFATLLAAHEAEAARGTVEADSFGDDATLVEAHGATVVMVPGDPRAMKLTTPAELGAIRYLLESGL